MHQTFKSEENKMQSSTATKNGNQKRVTKIQLGALTAALLVVLVTIPASADHWDEIEYTAAYEASTDSVDADSARMTALGEYFASQGIEAGIAAASSRYAAMAALYGESGGAIVAQDADLFAANPELKSLAAAAGADSSFYAENPETKYASGWQGNFSAASSGSGSENPELTVFQQYCGC
jgi:hypothetical protein